MAETSSYWNQVDEDILKFCKEVDRKRKEKGWTASELSKRTGIELTKICYILKAKRSLRLEDTLILAECLDISLDEIFNLV